MLTLVCKVCGQLTTLHYRTESVTYQSEVGTDQLQVLVELHLAVGMALHLPVGDKVPLYPAVEDMVHPCQAAERAWHHPVLEPGYQFDWEKLWPHYKKVVAQPYFTSNYKHN